MDFIIGGVMFLLTAMGVGLLLVIFGIMR